MNELKPEDVMRALECCLQADGAPDCYKLGCPARMKDGLCFYETDCEFEEEAVYLKKMLADALALLREKDAEIERLRAECSKLTLKYSKAITEFAERVKGIYGIELFYGSRIDQIAKEITNGRV